MIRSENFRLLLIGFGFVAIQVILLRHLQIYDAVSDLVLLFVLWLCTKKDRTTTLLIAGFLGLLQDSLTDLWGLNMFSKTLLVFVLHGFLNRTSENSFLIWQVFLIVSGAAFLHNIIFYFVSSFSGVYASEFVVFSLLIVSTLYTAALGSFLHLVRTDN